MSDLAAACPGCARPIAAAREAPQLQTPPTAATRGGGVLPSNLSALHTAEPSRPRRGFPLAGVLLGLLVLVAAAAVATFIVASARPGGAQAAARATPTPAPTEVPVGASSARRAGSSPPVALPDVNGISCDALESTIVHIHAHLAVFVDGQEQVVPFGVGIGQPWQVSDSAEGPFVNNGSCFYWIHTHTQDGVLHVESPIARTFTLGDFFAIWQVPLSATQLGPIQGTVIAYVNGSRTDGDPALIPLTSHGQIQLDIGQDVPQYAFRFPPGT